jgi:hypothetical protein
MNQVPLSFRPYTCRLPGRDRARTLWLATLQNMRQNFTPE